MDVIFSMISRLFPLSPQRLVHYLVLISFLAGIAKPSWAQFETRATTTLPQGAFSIAAGDFNNDGFADVVVIDDNGMTVSLGKGDGTFQKPAFYTTQLSYSVAVADFNGDGNLDIVVANLNPSTVDVYLGNGNGTFKAPISSSTTKGSYFVTTGDFNNDGKLDIAIIDPPYVSVLLGKGNGRFQAPSDNDSLVGALWLAIGDFNNDHNLDVVATAEFGESYDLGVLLGNGNGTLQDSIITPLEYVPAGVAVGDLNGDGNLDAVVGDDLDGLAVLIGDGNGSFQPPVYYNTTGLGGGEVIVSDLNLSGKSDVVLPSGVGVDVFWGVGDGTLGPAQFLESGETGLPALGDLNGDGLPDLALSNDVGTTTMLNTGVVSFSPTTAPLTFPVQPINTTSPQQSLKLTNNGTSALSISSMKISAGVFQMRDTCGSSVAVGASCSISTTYKPKNAGTQTALITIIDSASSQPQFVELTGSATVIKVSPTSLTFGTHVGSTAITFSSVGVTANQKDFSATGNCTGHAIQPSGSCKMSVTFDPTKTGNRAAGLYFNLPLGSISPLPVALSGTGD
jgi:hypothetical protein